MTQAEHIRIGGAKAELVKALEKTVRGVHFNNHTAQWLIGLLFCAGGLALVTLVAADPPAAMGMVVFVTVLSGWVSGVVAKIREGSGSMLVEKLILIVPLVMACVGLIIIGAAAGIWGALATLLVIVAAPVFHFLIKAPTRAGRKVLDVIAGFREYLTVADSDGGCSGNIRERGLDLESILRQYFRHEQYFSPSQRSDRAAAAVACGY